MSTKSLNADKVLAMRVGLSADIPDAELVLILCLVSLVS